MSKDKPETLGDKVQALVNKLRFVRTYKEKQLKDRKLKEMAKKEILSYEMESGGSSQVPDMKDEVLHYKERYQAEKHTGETRKRELDAMEAKGATLKRTLEHD
jgi:hypothetical protein